MMYLQRRQGGVYYFRMAIPTRLTAAYGRKEIVFSLGTKDKADARLKSLEHFGKSLIDGLKLPAPPMYGRTPLPPTRHIGKVPAVSTTAGTFLFQHCASSALQKPRAPEGISSFTSGK